MFPKASDRCFNIIIIIIFSSVSKLHCFGSCFKGLNNKRLQLLFPSSTENINPILDIVNILNKPFFVCLPPCAKTKEITHGEKQ